MKVPVSWLNQYVKVVHSPVELAERLTNVGIAVETVTALGEGVQGCVAGVVLEAQRLPESDALWLVSVDTGGSRPLTIVTGAQNVRAGLRVPVAPPGAMVRGRRLAVAMVRGVESHGMLLSEAELGISEDHTGIMLLPRDTPVGADVSDLLGLKDHVLELELTANYAAHAQCLIGVAVEYGAVSGQPVRWPAGDTSGCADATLGHIDDQMRVSIAAPELCPRYSGRIVRGIQIGPSPVWMQAALRAAGMRPINNIVDITNYVMLELGQPLHAFDYDRLRGKQITVRRARPGERFRTLDGVNRVLDPDVLVIADGEGPVAMAGVMGGEESEVTDQTTNVFLESAWFENINNRATARKFDLPSEAASRYTKGVDPSGCIRALERAAQLMCEFAGGAVVPGIIDEYPLPYAPKVVPLRLSRLRTLIGLPISSDLALTHLEELGFAVLTAEELQADARRLDSGNFADPATAPVSPPEDMPLWRAVHRVSPVPAHPAAYQVWAARAKAEVLAAAASSGPWSDADGDFLVAVVPTRRLDVTFEDDLIEEVCRRHGYDRVEATLPNGPAVRGGRSVHQEAMLKTRRILAGFGLCEVMTYSLVTPKIYDRLRLPGDHPDRRVLTVQNPLFEERSTLRTVLVASLLDVLAHNVHRQVRDLAIFELAKVYHPVPGQNLPNEQWRLGIAAMGNQADKGWNVAARAYDYYWLKGVLEHLLTRLGVTDYTLGWATDSPYLHPGRHSGLALGGPPATQDHQPLGVFGEVHPEVIAEWDLTGRVYLAEIEFSPLALAPRPLGAYTPVPRFPAAARDVALVIGQEVPAAAVEAAILRAGGELVADLRLFDLYAGEQVPEGKRSLAYSITYQSSDRTLSDAEVSTAHNQVRAALIGLGAELRS